MTATILMIEFLLFSFVGWLLDSFYRSLDEKRWVNAGYFRGPVCPIYGFGGVILVYLFKTLSSLPLLLQIAIASLAMILVEYAGGIFSERILKVKLWDYSASKFHLGGHINLLHSLFWILLTTMFYFFFFSFVLALEK